MTKNVLGGMTWNIGAYAFVIPFTGNRGKAVTAFQSELAEITWSFLRIFVDASATLSETAAVLDGCRKNCSFRPMNLEALQIRNYFAASQALTQLILAQQFDLSKIVLCGLNGLAAKNDALEWGVFRHQDIGIQGVDYTPPAPGELWNLCDEGLNFLSETVSNPIERAFALFLFLSRSQFFFDANKRTASLMMNGCLMHQGYLPVMFSDNAAAEFREKLNRFYETGNADEMMRFFVKSTENYQS